MCFGILSCAQTRNRSKRPDFYINIYADMDDGRPCCSPCMYYVYTSISIYVSVKSGWASPFHNFRLIDFFSIAFMLQGGLKRRSFLQGCQLQLSKPKGKAKKPKGQKAKRPKGQKGRNINIIQTKYYCLCKVKKVEWIFISINFQYSL